MNKFVKKLLIGIVLLYLAYNVVSIFISQQNMLNTYAAEKKMYTNQINEAKDEQNQLSNSLESLNSTDYIEDIARNKLDMYLPNERVYIDITK